MAADTQEVQKKIENEKVEHYVVVKIENEEVEHYVVSLYFNEEATQFYLPAGID